ncbi:MAG: hypothetical protein Q9226_007599, partial [Calogaya cf. arnoldii]
SKLQAPLQALTLSSSPPSKTTVAFAIPQLHRHLTSIGIFGPGFGAVVPKWGGLAEIAQVACRAGAVGGGVYVLKKGIVSIERPGQTSASLTSDGRTDHLLSTVKLQGGDEVKARWIIGTPSTLHSSSAEVPQQQKTTVEITHVAAIVSSSLPSLFPPPAEGSPPPACIIAVLPPGSIRLPPSLDLADVPAIYLIIHSSDTGECPEGQFPSEPMTPELLWTLSYKQRHSAPSSSSPNSQDNPPGDSADHEKNHRCGIIHLKDLSSSLALEDDILKDVRAVWDHITADDGDTRGAFMQFEDRVGLGGEDDEDV